MDTPLYSISQIRLLEQAAIEQYVERSLMQRAGEAAFETLRTTWPHARRIIVICGTGNNGGDGLVLADCAQEAGFDVSIRLLGDHARYGMAANLAFLACKRKRIPMQSFQPTEQWQADVLVDALLGIGIKGKVAEPFQAAISAMNASGLPILAIDVPSGLNADTGASQGIVINAHSTITFIGLKQGLFTHEAVDHCGAITLSTLGLPPTLYKDYIPATLKLSLDARQKALRLRPKNSHKGDFGHVLIVGGNAGMAGAARLAAEAALRAGAGRVSVASLPGHQSLICAHYPEIMCHGVSGASELEPLLAQATVVVIGPGLGQDDWGKEMLNASLAHPLPTVLDADGLNLLGKRPRCQSNWLLTPHPGEAARLLDLAQASLIQADRFKAIDALALLGGTWILKGAGTLIKSQDSLRYLCPFGNPGMASGGMGDALSGLLAGLIAQHFTLLEAAKLGVLVHALAADEAAKEGKRGLVASDVIARIKCWVNDER